MKDQGLSMSVVGLCKGLVEFCIDLYLLEENDAVVVVELLGWSLGRKQRSPFQVLRSWLAPPTCCNTQNPKFHGWACPWLCLRFVFKP